MSYSHSARTAGRRTPSALLAVLMLVVLTLGSVVGCRSVGSSPAEADDLPRQPQSSRSGPVGAEDGLTPDGTTVFDEDVPAVANLDPDLLRALRTASTAAAAAGVELEINSGWRSPAYQEQLLDQAVATYGSRAEAARWVATAETSPHVSGDAVDIGPSVSATWLSEHGAEYGLCQIYRNEPWHYELRPEAVGHGCPAPYADPTHDPRMQ